jgi:hypothetical protein
MTLVRRGAQLELRADDMLVVLHDQRDEDLPYEAEIWAGFSMPGGAVYNRGFDMDPAEALDAALLIALGQAKERERRLSRESDLLDRTIVTLERMQSTEPPRGTP